MSAKKTTNAPVDPLELLFDEWKSELADRGVTPESEAALRALPPERAATLLRAAIARLSGVAR